jgi:hypothetical protein
MRRNFSFLPGLLASTASSNGDRWLRSSIVGSAPAWTEILWPECSQDWFSIVRTPISICRSKSYRYANFSVAESIVIPHTNGSRQKSQIPHITSQVHHIANSIENVRLKQYNCSVETSLHSVVFEGAWCLRYCKRQPHGVRLFCQIDCIDLDWHDIEGAEQQWNIFDDEQLNSVLYL